MNPNLKILVHKITIHGFKNPMCMATFLDVLSEL